MIESSQAAPLPNTPAAAATTEIFPIASLREQIQTNRMFASPSGTDRASKRRGRSPLGKSADNAFRCGIRGRADDNDDTKGRWSRQQPPKIAHCALHRCGSRKPDDCLAPEAEDVACSVTEEVNASACSALESGFASQARRLVFTGELESVVQQREDSGAAEPCRPCNRYCEAVHARRARGLGKWTGNRWKSGNCGRSCKNWWSNVSTEQFRSPDY